MSELARTEDCRFGWAFGWRFCNRLLQNVSAKNFALGPHPQPHSAKIQKAPNRGRLYFGGEGGIRTHEGLQTLAGFQDQCIRPLCHLSKSGSVKRPRIVRAARQVFNLSGPASLKYRRCGRIVYRWSSALASNGTREAMSDTVWPVGIS